MLDANEVLEATMPTSVGGVCPFGLPRPLASTPICRCARSTSSTVAGDRLELAD